MGQEEKKYTKDELANMFFEQVTVVIMDGMSKILDDISSVNSKINTLKLFSESEDLDEKLPNIGITLNNKLVEIYQDFKEHGINIFEGYDEERGIRINGLIPAYIIENLINNYVVPQSEKMVEYLTTAKVMEKIKETNEEEMQKRGPIGKGIMLIKAMFNSNNSIYFEDDELEILRKGLKEYKQVNESIYNYNLQDNLVEAILKHFENTGESLEEIEEKVEQSIISILQMLGMEDKIQELKSKIKERFGNRKRSDWKLSKSEKQKLYKNIEKEKSQESIVECEVTER